MDYAQSKNRLLAYLFDLLLTLIITSGALSFLIFKFNIDVIYYILIVLTANYFVYILFISIILKASKGYTLGGVIFKVRITQNKNKRLDAAKLLVRTSLAGLLVVAILDIIYLKINNTNLSPIDKITNTLVVES